MRRKNKSSVVVITRKIRIPGEAHGGAWKVAYADFVTAMMAFFLLLWLLNASTKAQVAGIAEYFMAQEPVDNELAASTEFGENELEGVSEDSVQPLKFDSSNPSVLKLLKAPKDIMLGSTDQKAEKTVLEDRDNVELQSKPKIEVAKNSTEGIPLVIQASDSSSQQKNTMLIEAREDGLDAHITSAEGVFVPGTAEITVHGNRQLAQISTLLASGYGDVRVNIEGHASRADGNLWELSLARAFSVMQWMTSNGFDQDNVQSVDGFAAKNLLNPDNPESIINDRVTLKFIAFERLENFDQ